MKLSIRFALLVLLLLAATATFANPGGCNICLDGCTSFPDGYNNCMSSASACKVWTTCTNVCLDPAKRLNAMPNHPWQLARVETFTARTKTSTATDWRLHSTIVKPAATIAGR